MQNKRNYYRVLHLQPDAPQAMIKTAYRTIMQKLKAHPDLGGDEWNASLINEAYETLSNTVKRKAYDNNFFANREKAQAASQSQGQRKKAKTRSNNSAKTKSESKGEQQKSSKQRSHHAQEDRKQQNHKHQERSQQEQQRQDHSKQDRSKQESSKQEGSKQQGKAEQPCNNQEYSCLFCGAKYLSSAITNQDDCISCNSPLHLPSINNSQTSDRRDSLRMPSGTSLTLLTRHAFQSQGQANRSNGYAENIFSAAGSKGKTKGKVLDISLTGIRIQSQTKQSLGDIVQVESDTLIALAEVNNQVNPKTYVYGLKFLTLKFKQDKGGFVSTAV